MRLAAPLALLAMVFSFLFRVLTFGSGRLMFSARSGVALHHGEMHGDGGKDQAVVVGLTRRFLADNMTIYI
jgi:hypothetical protein